MNPHVSVVITGSVCIS